MLVIALPLLGTMMACFGDAQEPVVPVESEIIGGTLERDQAFDAVGALVQKDAKGQWSGVCTATLFTQNRIVTAKHCLPLLDPTAATYFAIGANARAPKARILVERWIKRGTNTGGLLGHGLDVAEGVLSASVASIAGVAKVAPITPALLSPGDVGAPFKVIGFGAGADQLMMTMLRLQGSVSLKSLSGNFYELSYGSLDNYLRDEFLTRAEGEKKYYSHSLVRGQEVFVAEGKTHLCHGDSGGPLLRKVGKIWHMFGVLSGGVDCNHGDVYATFDKASLGL
jgi:Trypsin